MKSPLLKKEKFSFEQYASGIIVPLLVLGLAGAAYFLIIPKYKDVKAASLAFQNKKASVTSLEDSLSGVQKLVADLGKKEAELKVVDEALPDAPRIPELLSNLDHLARQSGLLIANLQIAPAPTLATAGAGQAVASVRRAEQLAREASDLTVLNIDLGLKGRYPNVKIFLANLEKNLRIMDIQAITFGSTEVETGLQEYTLRIQTYYQRGGT